MDFFTEVQKAPPDPILGLARAFTEDGRSNKVNLGVGAYRTAEAKPLILTTVKEAEKRLLESEKSKDYLPIEGEARYVELSYKLLFGASLSEEVAAVQTVGGTSALRVIGQFLQSCGIKQLYLPTPTWGNHKRIFTHAGLQVVSMPYYNSSAHLFAFDEYMDFLESVPSYSAILLHGCCHNPSGVDPTFAQWQAILAKIKERQLFPFFDIAYQGFGEGLEEDAAAIRLFREAGIEMAVAMSFSKNFGLYAERVGGAFIVTSNKEQKQAVQSQLTTLIRGNYSNPPCHGARIVAEILGDKVLYEAWSHELASMRERISSMRTAFTRALAAKAPPGKEPFAHLAKAKGMFAFTGLRQDQVEQLISEYGIYMLKSGRINVAGLTMDNLDYVTEAIMAVYAPGSY